MRSELYIGLISGTSMDGIDAVLVRLTDSNLELIATHSLPWPDPIKRELLALANPGVNEIDRLGVTDAEAGNHFAAAALELLQKANLNPSEVRAIGCHGQTIRHRPQATSPFTLQIGDPNRIAERTGITTVADFRRRDMAAGGEGAPLVPAFHTSLFQSREEERVILNIGGIANLTLLPTDPAAPVLGYDTGPGNCLMDAWTRYHQQQAYDPNGSWAASGKVNDDLLENMLGDDYFRQCPPKSTGPEYFSRTWLDAHIRHFPEMPAADIQATLSALSAVSIAEAIKVTAPNCQRILVCGGGAHNGNLLSRLRAKLDPAPVENTEAYGLAPDWVEATAFAWLARQTLNNKPGNLPAVTGARHPVVLGGIYQA